MDEAHGQMGQTMDRNHRQEIIRNIGSQIKEIRQWHAAEQEPRMENYIYCHMQ